MDSIPSPSRTPASGNAGAAKAALRKGREAVRAAARARHPAADAALAARFGAFLSRMGIAARGSPAPVAAGYWPVRSELSPLALMADIAGRGMATALPVTPPPGGTLAFRAWGAGDGLVGGGRGIPGPGPEAPPVTPDIVLVPLLAFDGRCHRLGYGAGCYDRAIAALRAGNPRVGVLGIAYAEQRVGRLPVAGHDQGLDAVLTPSALHWPDGAA